jgi:serine/threonine-protein kinase RsbW
MTERWVWLFDRVIASDTKAARVVLDEMLAQLEAQHWQQRDIFAVHLATEEALVNAIYHGNDSDAGKNVHVVCRLSGDRIRIEISDEGGGFNPSALPDPTENDQLHVPCGRGVMLMRAFMSRVEFNEQGNAVVMEKDRNLVAG